MTEIVQAIKDALSKFSHQDLCEGAEVRDTLLDLLLLANGGSINAEITDKGLIKPLKAEKV